MDRIKFGEIRINDIARNHIKECLDNNWPTMGPKTKLMEEEWAKKFNTKYAVGVSSGTDALICALLSLYDMGAQRGDYVVVPALSFISTVSAVIAAGFVPLLVDVKKNMLIDESLIETAILSGGHRVKAIIPVTLMGCPPKMDYIQDIAKKYNLTIIVDNCEGHLCTYKNQNMEYWGDMACYSGFAAHVVAASEVGVVTTNYREFDGVLRSVRSHGRKGEDLFFDFKRYGLNCKPTDMDASLVLGSLHEVTWTFNTRKRNYYHLYRTLAKFSDKCEFTTEEDSCCNSPHAFSMIMPNEELCNKLKMCLDKANIEWKKNFGAYHTHSGWRHLANRGDYPIAEHCGDNGIHIGIHAYLSEAERSHISTTLYNFFEKL